MNSLKTSSPLLINLSFLAAQPTGHSIYAKNVVAALKSLAPTLLTAQPYPEFNCYSIPDNLAPENGIKGHLNRLRWIQFELPKPYHQLQGRLLFSPIPEAPLFTNVQHVVTLHDLIPLRFFSRFSAMRSYCRYYIPQVLNQAKQILCDSEATAKDAIDFCQVPANKITVVPLAYDANHFRFLDLPTQNYFLYMGRHQPYKNLHRVMKAFATLPSDYEFWIAGSIDKRYTPNLIAEIEHLQLSDRVKFLSYVSYAELPELINRAVSLVFPSLWEGFGLPVLEAMACGTPVITSNLSSMPEVAGDAALLVDPYDETAIADAMKAIVTEPQLHDQLRQKGLDRTSHFSWQKTAAQTAEILKQYL
ncbi:MAG: glycosyltransferase family 4 protein [Plectolyngbya sp. WJT66-NPBG17]|jgi:glycosyltransferase involved in cell wall biosynthesis|nr:glycosyltransferase family 4 protein [Plectolyngbya sp. WJT66-NPBG17]MBW4524531.1 glycosyltransferase family 4 protein [Phormidium tanganyikae FI6-MK23]